LTRRPGAGRLATPESYSDPPFPHPPTTQTAPGLNDPVLSIRRAKTLPSQSSRPRTDNPTQDRACPPRQSTSYLSYPVLRDRPSQIDTSLHSPRRLPIPIRAVTTFRLASPRRRPRQSDYPGHPKSGPLRTTNQFVTVLTAPTAYLKP